MTGATDDHAPPRADLKDAIFWIALGVATLVGSVAMDRLESQNIEPVTAPGLLPGLLGICLILLGGILGLRSWRRGAFAQAPQAVSADARERRLRVAVAVALCAGYSVVLVGHGIPFWLASAVYVSVSILVFRRLSHDPDERRLDARACVKAALIGVITSVVIWLFFEQVFLVRLP
jgi:hypothetical protein